MDADRCGQIVRLLDTRFDHLPVPVRRTEASTGFVHGEPARVTCSDCLANGKAMFGCETCGGRGYTEVKRERDPYATDKVMPYGLDGARHEATRARDREIEVLRRQLRTPLEIDEAEDAEAHPFAWERARARMYADFDYAALDRAIEWLRGVFPGVRLRGGCRGSGPSGCFALGYLDMVLPDPLRAPPAEGEPRVAGRVRRSAGPRVLSQRDEMIRTAVLEASVPTGEVARTWGLSVSQVNRIVGRGGG